MLPVDEVHRPFLSVMGFYRVLKNKGPLDLVTVCLYNDDSSYREFSESLHPYNCVFVRLKSKMFFNGGL